MMSFSTKSPRNVNIVDEDSTRNYPLHDPIHLLIYLGHGRCYLRGLLDISLLTDGKVCLVFTEEKGANYSGPRTSDLASLSSVKQRMQSLSREMQQTSEPSLTMKISQGGKEKESKVGREKERRPRIPKDSGFLSLH